MPDCRVDPKSCRIVLKGCCLSKNDHRSIDHHNVSIPTWNSRKSPRAKANCRGVLASLRKLCWLCEAPKVSVLSLIFGIPPKKTWWFMRDFCDLWFTYDWLKRILLKMYLYIIILKCLFINQSRSLNVVDLTLNQSQTLKHFVTNLKSLGRYHQCGWFRKCIHLNTCSMILQSSLHLEKHQPSAGTQGMFKFKLV